MTIARWNAIEPLCTLLRAGSDEAAAAAAGCLRNLALNGPGAQRVIADAGAIVRAPHTAARRAAPLHPPLAAPPAPVLQSDAMH